MRSCNAGAHMSHCVSLSLVLLVSLFFSSGCSTTKKPVVEASPAVPAAPVNQPKTPTNSLPSPELNAVKEAVKRVFKDAAFIDTARDHSFVAGDFNGDQSQDIAVVIKPDAQKIAAMNEEYQAWMLRDPFGSLEARSPRLRIAANDVLLAIIHGYGADGWHDPQATQTFLLKNAAGSSMQTRPLKEFFMANQGKKLPQLRGDVLAESIGEKSGYLYFADATYAWYDPKTFRGELLPRRGHGDQKLRQ